MGDSCEAESVVVQRELEETVRPFIAAAAAAEEERARGGTGLELARRAHCRYLRRNLWHLAEGFTALDASRTWIVYWITHGLALLGDPLEGDDARKCVAFLARCQDASGGFGGGPGQLPHLAPTYAAVSALLTLGGDEALGTVDRKALHAFLLRMKDPETGGFRMHDDGEVDVRGCYTAVATAAMLDILTPSLTDEALIDYIARCQTFEGGLGGEPGNEAHGGYTYCGFAALCLCGRESAVDLQALMRWAVHRQGSAEGGFMGRTHKLVDGCYSWWQGGIFPLVARAEEALNAQRAERIEVAKQRREQAQRGQNANAAPPATPGGAVAPLDPDWAVAVFPCARVLGGATAAAAAIVELDGDEDADEQAVHSTVPTLHNPNALQGWLLAACQADGGGLRDKPGKGRDFYHSCYCLSGLSAAQHHGGIGGAKVVVGSADNLLEETHPLFNVVTRQVEASERYFSARPLQLP